MMELCLFQCLYKTQGTRRRQWPPSREEIMCTINRRPIYARFHFMDGQYHAVEFYPSATARDVMEIVKTKIGLRESAMGKLLKQSRWLWGAFDSAKNHKRQRRKRQSVTTKREKSQTPKFV